MLNRGCLRATRLGLLLAQLVSDEGRQVFLVYTINDSAAEVVDDCENEPILVHPFCEEIRRVFLILVVELIVERLGEFPCALGFFSRAPGPRFAAVDEDFNLLNPVKTWDDFARVMLALQPVTAPESVITNYHVIKEAHSAVVKLSNGAFFPVTGVLASEADKDLAIIKVNGRNLPFLSLGDIEKLHVGDHVVAIGSPLGLEGTVSDGIVSALRDVASKKWIQTTAPVSHGNSGGPLLDMSNHVVGVITWGVNLELGQNLNFAAPSSEVTAMLVTAHQEAKPLESVASRSDDSFTAGTLWTSLTTGHDYNLRHDGDYLYVDWVNVPPDVKTAGRFLRSEVKKSADGKWRGKTHLRMPCTYTQGRGAFIRSFTNWYSRDVDIEIDLVSDKRIEGMSTGQEKFDCRKCEAEGKAEQKPFTWIPKWPSTATIILARTFCGLEAHESVWDWIAQNKQWVFSGVGVTALVVIWWLIKKLFGGKKNKPASGDPHINVNVSPTISPTISNTQNMPSSDSNKHSAPQPEPDIKAVLFKAEFAQRIGTGRNCFIISFRNDGWADATSVIAHIGYRSKSSSRKFLVDYGGWIEHMLVMNIGRGQTKNLIIAVTENGKNFAVNDSSEPTNYTRFELINVGEITPGDWTMIVTLSADNFRRDYVFNVIAGHDASLVCDPA